MVMTLRCSYCGELSPKHRASCFARAPLPTYDELVERAREKIRAAKSCAAPSPWATFPAAPDIDSAKEKIKENLKTRGGFTPTWSSAAPTPYVQPDTVLTKAVAGFKPKEEPPTKIAIDPNARYVRNLK